MNNNSPARVKSKMPVIIFLASLLVPLFWLLGQLINVYKTAWVGAVFELLWLPMILLLFTLPVLAAIYWSRAKFNFRSLYFYSLVILTIGIVLIITSNS